MPAKALSGQKLANELLRMANKFEARFRKAYLETMLGVTEDPAVQQLIRDIANGTFRSGDSVPARLQNVELNVGAMNEVARQTISASAQVTKQVMQLRGSFDIVNDAVVDAARQLSIDLSTNLRKTALESIRQTIEDFASGSISRSEATSQIQLNVGLLPQHAIAVRNYRQTLLNAGTNRAKANSLADSYAKRLLKYRANMIARTEVARATGIGQTNFWNQMQAQGMLPKNANRVWIAHPDEMMCEFCGAMNGKVAPIGGGWNTPKGYFEYPQASHPHCRCSAGITMKRSSGGNAIAKIDEAEWQFWLLEKGESAGHPFRGNQYTEGTGGSPRPKKKAKKKTRPIRQGHLTAIGATTEPAPVRPRPMKVKPDTSFSYESKIGTVKDSMEPSPEEVAMFTEHSKMGHDDAFDFAHSIFGVSVSTKSGEITSNIDYVNSYLGKIVVFGDVLRDGVRVGKFQRELNAKDHSVYNAVFKLSDASMRGSGVGTVLMNHWEDQLAKAGIKKMNVHALTSGKDWNGAYTWAKYGYKPKSINDAKSLFYGFIEECSNKGAHNKDTYAVLKQLAKKYDIPFDEGHYPDIEKVKSSMLKDYGKNLLSPMADIPLFRDYLKGTMNPYQDVEWNGTKPTRKLKIKKSAETQDDVVARWMSEDPIGLENDDPQFWAEIKASISVD